MSKNSVYVVVESHKAEGDTILAVYAEPPSEAEVLELSSAYDAAERARWCRRFIQEHDVIHGH